MFVCTNMRTTYARCSTFTKCFFVWLWSGSLSFNKFLSSLLSPSYPARLFSNSTYFPMVMFTVSCFRVYSVHIVSCKRLFRSCVLCALQTQRRWRFLICITIYQRSNRLCRCCLHLPFATVCRPTLKGN